MQAYSVPERFTPWSTTVVPAEFTSRFPCTCSADTPGAGAGGGAGAVTANVPAEFVQLLSVTQPGEKIPTATAYVPIAAVAGTGQLTGYVRCCPAAKRSSASISPTPSLATR